MTAQDLRELSAFVRELMDFLRANEEMDLAARLARAIRLAPVSTSEYLNEVELALKRVLIERPRDVSAEREDEIRRVVQRIDDTFASGAAD